MTIIGLTIGDNDYADLMDRFARAVAEGEFDRPEPGRDPDASYAAYRRSRQLRHAMNKAGPLDDSLKAILRDAVLASWRALVRDRPDREYLEGRLEVTFPESVNAEWRNGEQYYVFPAANGNKTLNF